MYPEHRVLVGVIKTKRDLDILLNEHWYRIPYASAPRGADAEYIAVYTSSGVKEKNGGIHYYGWQTGHELLRRRDLIPNEPKHSRANEWYYKFTFKEIKQKIPPILNTDARKFAFIFTTWDRFIQARTLTDLYSKADWFVERVRSVLESRGIRTERFWEQQEETNERLTALRIECERGIVRAAASVGLEGILNLEPGDTEHEVSEGVRAIQEAVAAMGGPKLVDISPE
jgi:hypothetical protein